MTTNEIKAAVRESAAKMILPAILDANPIKIDAHKCYAVPFEIDGKTVYAEIKITAKNWYDTKVAKAYNPMKKA